MQTILIVEDEKIIRQGIRKMIERFDIEVGTILEASNGIQALKVLGETKVDLMLTDVKMPKMDGIELVSKIQKMDEKPLIVTISGFDDFEYAVKMLRGGVREYLLKPIEREKLKEVLLVLDEEIKIKKNIKDSESGLTEQQLKYLLLNEEITEEEKDSIYFKVKDSLFDEYRVMCGITNSLDEIEGCIKLNKVDINDLIIYPLNLEEELKNRNFHKYVGISNIYNSVEQLNNAYKESLFSRKSAFFNNHNYVYFDSDKNKSDSLKHHYVFDEDLMLKASKMVGINKIDELLRIIKYLASDTKAGLVEYQQFEKLIIVMIDNIFMNYQNIIELERDDIKHFNVIYDRLCLDDYIKEINTWIIELYSIINIQYDDYKNKKKIMDAKKYIDENFNKDINMAVVSNYVSMNYSLFSLTFKQYSGDGFNKYLRNVRISKAKVILETTEEKIKFISRMVGFNNEKLFMKNFKIVTGMSPSEYRKQLLFKD
jgi:YesN/AraC family two-component response regulator